MIKVIRMNKKQMVWVLFLFGIILVLGSFGLSSLTGKPFHHHMLELLGIVVFSMLIATVICFTLWVYDSLSG